MAPYSLILAGKKKEACSSSLMEFFSRSGSVSRTSGLLVSSVDGPGSSGTARLSAMHLSKEFDCNQVSVIVL